MPYQLDLSAFSVQEYKQLLKRQNLLPGRRMLWENIDANFKAIEAQGAGNISVLKKQLSTPQKLAGFAAASGIPEAYLTLLKREIGSLEQKPVPLASFPGIDSHTVDALNARGIKSSKDYLEAAAEEDELACLCRLVRINGVGAVAAKAFYEAGYRSVEDVACAEAGAMLKEVTKVNDAHGYYKAKLGEKDMQFCIDFASLLIAHTSR